MSMRMRMRMRSSLSMSFSFSFSLSFSLTIIIKIFFSGQNIKMSYYWFNRQEILQKAKERYSREKVLSIIYKTKKS